MPREEDILLCPNLIVRHGLAEMMGRRVRKATEDLRAHADLSPRFPDDLPHLRRQAAGQLFPACVDGVRAAVQDADPLMPGRVRPEALSLLRRVDGAQHILFRRQRNIVQVFLRRGIDHFKRRTVGGAGPLTVDKHLHKLSPR